MSREHPDPEQEARIQGVCKALKQKHQIRQTLILGTCNGLTRTVGLWGKTFLQVFVWKWIKLQQT